MSLTLYHNNISVCAQRVRLVLHEKGLTADEEHLNLRAGDQFQPDYLKLNPAGVVPTLVHDGEVITESAAISEYLEEAFPETPVRPEAPAARAAMRRWTVVPDAGLHAATGALSFAVAFRHQYLAMDPQVREADLAATPDPARRERKRQAIDLGLESPGLPAAIATYARVVARMEAALDGQDWLVGNAYSLADVAMTPYVVRLDHLQCAGVFQDNPRLAAWLDRVRGRGNFAAIGNYLDGDYVDLMAEKGREAWPKLAPMFEANG